MYYVYIHTHVLYVYIHNVHCVYTHVHTHAYLLKSVLSYLIRNSSDISKKNKAIVPIISTLISTLMQLLVKVIDHKN